MRLPTDVSTSQSVALRWRIVDCPTKAHFMKFSGSSTKWKTSSAGRWIAIAMVRELYMCDASVLGSTD